MMIRALEPSDVPALRALASRPAIAAELDVAPDAVAGLVQFEHGPKVALGAFDGARLLGAAGMAPYPRLRMRRSAMAWLACEDDRVSLALLEALRDLGRDWWALDRLELNSAARPNVLAVAGFVQEVHRHRDLGPNAPHLDSYGFAWIRDGIAMAPGTREFPRAERKPLPDDFVIRPALAEDAPGFVEVLSDPAVTWATAQAPFTTVAAWRERLAKNDDRNRVFVATAGGRQIANCGLHGNPGVNRQHVWSLGMAVAGAYQGRGVGLALMEHLLALADGLQIPRVELEVNTDNTRAVKLYEMCGFVHEGRKRAQLWRENGYCDSFTMARLRDA